MDQSDWLAVAAFCIVAIWFLSPTFRSMVSHVVVGPPNLRIDELPGLIRKEEELQIDRNPSKKIPGADGRVQVFNEIVSIIYHVTKHAEGVAETVDISHIGKCGMIFTMQNGTMTVLERIGGTSTTDPQLSPEDSEHLAV